MEKKSINLRRIRNLTGSILLATGLSACGFEDSNNVPGVPATGLFAAVAANQHSGEDSTQVAVAIFDDGEPINLVGGDVVRASTSAESILLLDRGFYKGSYVANLPNTANLDQINLSIVHEPVEARQNRWYPADLINIDPGPGELVGSSATINLPPEPEILLPVMDSLYTGINDSFDVSWTPLNPSNPDDIMKIQSAIICDNGIKTSSYGTEVTLLDNSDDGFETVRLNQLIYDLTTVNPGIVFISGARRALLQAILEKLSSDAVADSFFANTNPVNPISSICEIQLFLFRQRPGSFSSPSTNGNIFGSRSSDVTIFYDPN